MPFYMYLGLGELVGVRDMYLVQGSQMVACLSTVSKRMLSSPGPKSHEIFLLTKKKETVGCFQARAIVSLVPWRINIMMHWANFRG